MHKTGLEWRDISQISWKEIYSESPKEDGEIIAPELKLTDDQVLLLQLLSSVLVPYQASRKQKVREHTKIIIYLCYYVSEFISLFCEPEIETVINYIENNYAKFRHQLFLYTKHFTRGENLVKKSYFIYSILPNRKKTCIHIQGHNERQVFARWLHDQGAKDVTTFDEEYYQDLRNQLDIQFIDRASHPQLYREVIDEIINPSGDIWMPTKHHIITKDDIKKVKNLVNLNRYTLDEIAQRCNLLEKEVLDICLGEYDEPRN